MTWENFVVVLMRDELFFILSSLLAIAAVTTLVSFFCLRVCRLTTKVVLIVVLLYAILLMLLQISAIPLPRSVEELGTLVGLPKNFTQNADPMSFVRDAWTRARRYGSVFTLVAESSAKKPSLIEPNPRFP
jgi:hypothetical protein